VCYTQEKEKRLYIIKRKLVKTVAKKKWFASLKLYIIKVKGY
jgi:hypothetical protein